MNNHTTALQDTGAICTALANPVELEDMYDLYLRGVSTEWIVTEIYDTTDPDNLLQEAFDKLREGQAVAKVSAYYAEIASLAFNLAHEEELEEAESMELTGELNWEGC